MNLDKMTLKLRQAIQDADMISNENGNAEITTEHVLLALLSQKEGLLSPLFDKLGIPSKQVQAKIQELISRLPKVYGTNGQRSLSGQPWQRILCRR